MKASINSFREKFDLKFDLPTRSQINHGIPLPPFISPFFSSFITSNYFLSTIWTKFYLLAILEGDIRPFIGALINKESFSTSVVQILDFLSSGVQVIHFYDMISYILLFLMVLLSATKSSSPIPSAPGRSSQPWARSVAPVDESSPFK